MFSFLCSRVIFGPSRGKRYGVCCLIILAIGGFRVTVLGLADKMI